MSATKDRKLEILERWSQEEHPTPEEEQYILQQELATGNAGAFGLTEENGLEKIAARSHLFTSVASDILDLCQTRKVDHNQGLRNLWNFWLPFALELIEVREKLQRPLVQGILGGQGTGKSTIASAVQLILGQLGYSSVALSLDDLYKSYIERQQLQRFDPRIIWRGPPGTHDVEIGIELLDKLRQATRTKPVVIPRFDKSAWQGAGDKADPEIIDPVDIILFEGWFVGVRPVPDDSAFDHPPDPIRTEEDRQFARDMNERLMDYVHLWHRLDRLVVLNPVDYRLSKQWRKEAEQKMREQKQSGMTDGEIDEFVEYFWKALHPELFITPLVNNPILTDLVVEVEADHTIGKIYRPTTQD
ncbi:glycerate kinase [Spirulina sp. CS-785/01]|uniref:glycerate kinase n=1 Tax=Spirulina sp. CS-785/01 TaxID=3021716 RepID=UPI002330CF9C|nr:glycerate kinase [Spirulina sp. CS-785/01]MDB9314603.1 glycerate kinase [Spirulina sp. CS-785/01]